MGTKIRRRVAFALCAGAVAAVGCSSSSDDSTDTTPDSGGFFNPDAGDAATDATAHADGGADSSLDATHADATQPDATPPADAMSDVTTVDDGGDGGTDGALSDGETDAAPDAAIDAGSILPAAVAIWEFQDAPGSTTAVDSSGNGHTATLEGTAAIVAGTGDAGTSGNYLQIDGTLGAFADVTGGPLFDNSQSFSISTWVSFPSFNNNYDELISADGAHVSVFELQLAPLSAGGGATTYNSEAAFPTTDTPTPGVFYYGFSTLPPVISTWYHIVGVYDLSTSPGLLSLYVDGVLQSNLGDSTALGSNPVAAVGDFIIGAGKYNDARTNGAVANYMGVRVYATALNAAQVLTLYGMTGR